MLLDEGHQAVHHLLVGVSNLGFGEGVTLAGCWMLLDACLQFTILVQQVVESLLTLTARLAVALVGDDAPCGEGDDQQEGQQAHPCALPEGGRHVDDEPCGIVRPHAVAVGALDF